MSQEYKYWDYNKAENTDDEEKNSELQSRLYAEIYYKSNIENDVENQDISRTQKNNTDQTNIESKNIQYQFKDFRKEPYKNNPKELESTIGKVPCSAEIILTNRNILNNERPIDVDISNVSNSVVYERKNDNNKNIDITDSITIKRKEQQRRFKIKGKYKRYMQDDILKNNSDSSTKYNVIAKGIKRNNMLIKEKQAFQDNSDSEESVCEVPIPPKPKPLLINLNDSDENTTDSNANEEKSQNLKEKICDEKNMNETINIELEIGDEVDRHVFFRSKDKNKSSSNQEMSVSNKNISSRNDYIYVDENNVDIVLNCTQVQKGARSINEIRYLSKSADLTNQVNVLSKDSNITFEKELSKSKTRCNEQIIDLRKKITSKISQSNAMQKHSNIGATSPIHDTMYNFAHTNDISGNSRAKVSGNGNDQVMKKKKRCELDYESEDIPKQKKQCIVQSNQNIISQSTNTREKSNESWNDYFFKPMPEKLRNFYNNSQGQENFDIDELQKGMSRDPRKWAILDADLMPRPSRRGRYSDVKCSHCHRHGHMRQNCQEPRRPPHCYICGTIGHTETRCPQKICLTCGKKQNTFRKTCEVCRILYCTMCNSVGHKCEQCPDLWRRFHQTTKEGQLPQDQCVMKPKSLLHCCNCTKRGHESSTCKEYRWSQHFPTPATVTNYTDGPMYLLEMNNPSERNFNTSISAKSKSDKMLTLQESEDTLETAEHFEFSSPIVNEFSSVLHDKVLTSQQLTCIPEARAQFEISEINKSVSKVSKKQKHETILKKLKLKQFAEVLYSCGSFENKDHKLARAKIAHLSKKCIYVNDMVQHKIFPVFIEKLLKYIEFEVTIGWPIHGKKALIVQLVTMETYQNPIMDLILHWIRLPIDEKDYAVDVNLPINPTKMVNLLNSRMPQLNNRDPREPRILVSSIKGMKNKMKRLIGTNKYLQLRTIMTRLQMKLLVILNTQPKPNKLIHELSVTLEKLKQVLNSDRLDATFYLQIVLLFNYLFVPHTPRNLYNKINKISQQKTKMNDTKCSSEMQKLERTIINQENFSAGTNTNFSLPTTTQGILQNVNLDENSTMTYMQNVDHVTLIETNDDISSNTNYAMDDYYVYSSDGVVNNCTQNCCNTAALNSEITQIINLRDPDKDQGQWSTDNKNNKSNICANAHNMNTENNNQILSTKKSRKLKASEYERITKILSKKNKKKVKKLNSTSKLRLNTQAEEAIKRAREFQLPHIMQAVKKLEEKLHNNNLLQKHVDALCRLIKLEKKHKQSINSYSSYFK